MVGLSLTYNIPKFFELKLIFAEEDPNMFEGLINHSAISSAEHQNIEQPFTHLEVRNITVDIVATDLRLNQVITLFIFQYFLNLIPYSTFTMMNVVECSFSRAYRKTTQNDPERPTWPTVVKGCSIFFKDRIFPKDLFRFTKKDPLAQGEFIIRTKQIHPLFQGTKKVRS